MPIASLTPCSAPGCPELVSSGRCEQHRIQRQRGYDAARGTRSQRGYDADWYRWLVGFKAGFDIADKLSSAGVEELLARNRCAHCWIDGKRTIHDLEYDHIVPLEHGGARLSATNVQPLCKACHNGKTASERAGTFVVSERTDILIVYGPPCGGKTTWARERYPIERIVDSDYIMAEVSGFPLHISNADCRDKVNSMYWSKVGAIRDVAVIATHVIDARARYTRAAVQLIDPGFEVCMERAASRPEPERTRDGIRRWYRQ